MSEVLIGGIEKREIVIVDYDPRWPEEFRKHAAIVSQALGAKALSIEHVGSTSVPELGAKPIIDIDVVVADSRDEPAYLPHLVAAGYVLRVREPGWHEHRMLRTPELDVHIHVFSRGCLEVARHLAFRNHLRSHSADRLRYELLKRRLAREDWSDMNAYARAKSELVEEILRRAMPPTSIFETERLIFRRLTTEDAEALYLIYLEPDVLKYFAHGPPESVAAERAGIERHLGYYEQHGFGLWATVLRDTGELIGRCGLLAQHVDGADEVEVAYLLSPRFWGRGLGSEAARAVRDYAFQSLGQNRLVSIIHPRNVASQRTASAVGMHFSKVSRLYNIDVEIFAIGRLSDAETKPS